MTPLSFWNFSEKTSVLVGSSVPQSDCCDTVALREIVILSDQQQHKHITTESSQRSYSNIAQFIVPITFLRTHQIDNQVSTVGNRLLRVVFVSWVHMCAMIYLACLHISFVQIIKCHSLLTQLCFVTLSCLYWTIMNMWALPKQELDLLFVHNTKFCNFFQNFFLLLHIHLLSIVWIWR